LLNFFLKILLPDSNSRHTAKFECEEEEKRRCEERRVRRRRRGGEERKEKRTLGGWIRGHVSQISIHQP
jgi:hypothetical protein